MTPDQSRVPYAELTAAADRMLNDCEDDAECLALRLGNLAPSVRDELIVSDLLNAWQIFFFFFRIGDDELRDLLELEPASALPEGIKLRQNDFVSLIFTVRGSVAVIALSDGEKVVTEYSGKDAYERGLAAMDSPEFQ